MWTCNIWTSWPIRIQNPELSSTFGSLWTLSSSTALLKKFTSSSSSSSSRESACQVTRLDQKWLIPLIVVRRHVKDLTLTLTSAANPVLPDQIQSAIWPSSAILLLALCIPLTPESKFNIYSMRRNTPDDFDRRWNSALQTNMRTCA